MKHTRKVLTLLIALTLAFTFCVCTFAAGGRVYDEADVLSSDEESRLGDIIDEASAKCGAEILVAVFDDMADYGYSDIMLFADNYVESIDPYANSVALVISMEERDYWITTSGECIDYITDAGIESIEDYMLSYLSSGDYYNAFAAFSARCETLITEGRKGNIYDYTDGNEPEGYPETDFVAEHEFPAARSGIISTIVGALAALFSTSSMKSNLRSVSAKSNAASYAISDSMNLMNQDDVFLYSNVSAVPKPRNTDSSGGSRGGGHSGGSTVHVSPGGFSHGGGGGKF